MSHPALHSVDAAPAHSLSQPAQHIVTVFEPSEGLGPLLDHWVDGVKDAFVGSLWDHSAIAIAPPSGPLFDHEADSIPLPTVPTQSTGSLWDHDVLVIPPPFTPLNPNAASIPEQKIPGQVAPHGCVGSGSSLSPGVCGQSTGVGEVVMVLS